MEFIHFILRDLHAYREKHYLVSEAVRVKAHTY